MDLILLPKDSNLNIISEKIIFKNDNHTNKKLTGILNLDEHHSHQNFEHWPK